MTKANRWASIDIGTNSVLCLIAEIDQQKGVQTVQDFARIVRLGEGLGQNTKLLPQAMDRTLHALTDYQKEIQSAGVPENQIRIIATAGMRKAENSNDFIQQVKESTGYEIEIIDGDREAELNFKAMNFTFLEQITPGKKVIAVDIGGGSTEVIEGTFDPKAPSIHQQKSMHMGSVWLTENFLKENDPPRSEQIQKMERFIDKAFQKSPVDWQQPLEMIGIAGTFTTLAAIKHGLEAYDAQIIHRSQLSQKDMEEIFRTLANKTVAERKQIPGLEPKRADVIVAGVAIGLGALRAAKAEHLWVSDHGIRNGLLWEKWSPHSV